MVLEASAAGVDYQAGGGDTSQLHTAAGPSARILDLLHDEHSFPQ